ncbi:universal stress protein [Candidatus Nitrosotenuis aquarius]|uniref:universal stress protein n=1 Tax=Candidatus Nitrosotenuis aquarius TaxID=1846278 RepID=UPI000C1EC738|nr:universal stress protein [Candidatus Nitrosotenuis aquarius]
MVYKTILVPFDGSIPSKNALKEAVELAKQSKGTIFLLYVVQEIVLPPWSGRATTHKTMREYEKEMYYAAKERASKLLEENAKKYDSVSIETQTLYGNTAEKILASIKNNKANLVVIGTTSRTGISKIITLGSVARKVAEKSTCPVLLVH